MSNPFRVASLAVLALVALPVLSACNTSPGSAAEVGSTSISTGSLQSQVNDSLAGGQLQKQQGFDRATFVRALLTHMISVDLVNAAAADHHVSVTTQDITAQKNAFVAQTGSYAALVQQAASGGVTAKQLPGFIRYAALQQKLGNALTANLTATPAQLAAEYQKDIDQYDQLKVAQIAVKSKTLADQILAKVRQNPATFAALATRYSLDTQSKAQGGLVGLVGRTEVQKLLGAKVPATPGTFAVAHSSGNYVVLHIISRSVQPASAVTAKLKAALFASQAQALFQKALSAEATKIGVHVSPRYGKWDNTTDAVVAVPDPTVTSTATPSPSTSG